MAINRANEETGLVSGVSTASRFAIGVCLTGGTNLVIAAFGMTTGILAARLLGPHGRGELAAIQITPGFIGALAMLGMSEALTYFSAQEPLRAGRYLATASAIALAACLPFMAAGFAAMPILLHAQRPQMVSVARWCLLIAPVWAVASMPMPVLRGASKVLSKSRVCLLEVNLEPLYESQATFEGLFQILIAAGYRYAGCFSQGYHANGRVIGGDALFDR